MPIKPTRVNNRLYSQEKVEARESWHKLVVKIISWKDGQFEGGFTKATDQVTTKEWKDYSKRILKTNITYGRDMVLSNLKELKRLIKEHGGFVEDQV